LFRFSAAESSLVDQVGKFLLHQLFDLGDGLVQSIFGCAGDVKV
jgi:hypothetical protein